MESFSSLIRGSILSPNCSSIPTSTKKDTISIHCMAGNLTAKRCGEFFSNSKVQASSNYGIGSDGTIYGYVPENKRSWCTSDWKNDTRAITIEVASSNKHPYEVTDKALKSLIKLLIDICKRHPWMNGLRWKNDPKLIGQVDKQNMTVHRWFKNKACPGEYLMSKHSYIADEVNKALGLINKKEPDKTIPLPEDNPKKNPKNSPGGISIGDKVKIIGNHYATGQHIPEWVKKGGPYTVQKISGDQCLLKEILSYIRKSDLKRA